MRRIKRSRLFAVLALILALALPAWGMTVTSRRPKGTKSQRQLPAAARDGCVRAIDEAVKAGANVNAKSLDGDTALDCAREKDGLPGADTMRRPESMAR